MKKYSLIPVLLMLFYVNAGATISQIRWGTTTDPLNGLTITWTNNGTTDSIKWGYTTAFEKGHFSATKRSGDTTTVSFFKYSFGSVTASSTIYYELYDSKAKTWGTQSTFKTAPPLTSTSFTFCALGDCRDYPSTLTQVSNLAAGKTPTFILFNGDLTVDGTYASEYNTFFNAASNMLANNLVFHAEGNHDAADPTMFSNLWDIPTVKGSNLYYSFTYGNTIFITINTNNPSDTAQLGWLNRTLAAANTNPAIIWKVVSCHHCFFTTGDHYGDMNSYRSTIWKAFDTYGVDFVLTGHDHNYQRSYPINLNVSSSKPVSQYGSATGQGRCEIVSGGSGAGLYANMSTPDKWAIDIFNETYNYTYYTVNGCNIKMIAYDNTGKIIDSLTFSKASTPACISTGEPVISADANKLNVYPNPLNNDNLNVHYTSAYTGNIKIIVTDINGREVMVKETNKPSSELQYSLDVAKLPNGTYQVSLVEQANRISKTVVISR